MSTDIMRVSLINRMAERYGVDPGKMLDTLKSTAFRQADGRAISNEQMMALLIVAEQYNLNPWTREIYAFPDKNGGIVPVVGVDGWARIVNEKPDIDGIEFSESEEFATIDAHHKPCPQWIECAIHRKDFRYAIVIKEYLDECYRPPFAKKDGGTIAGPWQSHTKRMLRHKAFIQCARIAYGFGGIYELDEAEQIVGRTIDADPEPQQQPEKLEEMRSELKRPRGRPKRQKEEDSPETPEPQKTSADVDVFDDDFFP